MEITNRIYVADRLEWRKWLEQNFDKEKEIWLVYPKKSSEKLRILYNDAVEEALCFGWIDSTLKPLDQDHFAQRYTPRNPKSSYSQPNKEKLKWLDQQNMLHPLIKKIVKDILSEEFVFPQDIMDQIRKDKEVLSNFDKFSDPYKRIRIAYIDGARQRPEEYYKRLKNFLEKTRANKLIVGFGGVEKYY